MVLSPEHRLGWKSSRSAYKWKAVSLSPSLFAVHKVLPPSLVPPKRILTLTHEQQTSIYTDVFIPVSPVESRNMFLVLRFIFIKVQHARLDVLKVLRTELMNEMVHV